MHMHVLLCVQVYMHICICVVWRPEDHFICCSSETIYLVHSLFFYLSLFALLSISRVSYWPGSCQVGQAGCQQPTAICLSPLPQCWDYKHMPPCLALCHMCPRVQALSFKEELFADGAIPLAPLLRCFNTKYLFYSKTSLS